MPDNWAKTAAILGGLFITALLQVIGLTWYFGTTLTKFEGKIELINQSISANGTVVSEFKADVKNSVGELRTDIKEISTMGLKVAKLELKIEALEHRTDVLEQQKPVLREREPK